MSEVSIDDEPDIEELLTLEQLRHRVSGRFGVIVIKDSTRGYPLFHHRDSACVAEHYFVEKVLDNDGANGRYWWAKNSKLAASELGAQRCGSSADPISKQ